MARLKLCVLFEETPKTSVALTDLVGDVLGVGLFEEDPRLGAGSLVRGPGTKSLATHCQAHHVV